MAARSINIPAAKDFIEVATGHEMQNDRLAFELLDTTGNYSLESNRRLALLGDKMLGLMLADAWYPSGHAVGTFRTDAIKAVVGNDHLAEVGREVGIGPYVHLNAGHRGPVTNKTMATTVEALVGAIWIDSEKDMTAVKLAMTKLGLTDFNLE